MLHARGGRDGSWRHGTSGRHALRLDLAWPEADPPHGGAS